MRLINLKQPGIYKITCKVNGKIYIGSAKCLHQRSRVHFSHLSIGKHKNPHLQAAFNLYGKNDFEFEVIEVVSELKDLLPREQYWLDKTQCYDNSIGFNICKIAGSHLGVQRTQEFKDKIKQAQANRSAELKALVIAAVRSAITGKPSWNKGMKMWEGKEHPKGTLGMKFPGRKFSAAGYAKICASNRRPRSEEYHQKRSFISSKVYFFNTPDSQLDLKIENLSEFCDRNGLNKTRMYQVAKGNESHHKGWTLSEFYK